MKLDDSLLQLSIAESVADTRTFCCRVHKNWTSLQDNRYGFDFIKI